MFDSTIPFVRVASMMVGIMVWGNAAMAEPATDIPAAFAVSGHRVIATLHGVGAQVYACKAGSGGALAWSVREPIATLLDGDKTVGRHYAGPNWDLTDGSGVTGKLLANQPAPAAADIPWLELQVVAHRGEGALSKAALVLRLHTAGGTLAGVCGQAGELRSVPYAADYLFLD